MFQSPEGDQLSCDPKVPQAPYTGPYEFQSPEGDQLSCDDPIDVVLKTGEAFQSPEGDQLSCDGG